MATYPELLSLFSNSALVDRITVAVIVAAGKIREEDVGTANHAERLAWAKSAFASPTTQSKQMLMALLAANRAVIVSAITGVTDEDLQTLVDDAVNTFAL